MTDKYIDVRDLPLCVKELRCGERVFLSGTVYTARDAAHKRLVSMIEQSQPLPFDIKNSVIYYAGPTPTQDNDTFGSFGPTTSSRMDAFSPVLLDKGLIAMIGKGNRNKSVIEAIVRNKAVYFCAGGGLGALISRSIADIKEIAFPELGCESIKELTVKNMPLTVGIDSFGNSIFNRKI